MSLNKMNETEKFLYLRNEGWRCDENGNIYGPNGKQRDCFDKVLGYHRINFRVGGERYFVMSHRFIYWYFNGEIPNIIDHKNRQKLDNSPSNLRSVTQAENQQNRLDRKGYTFVKRLKKFMSSISTNKKRMILGYFTNEEDARQAYLDAKVKYHGVIL